MEIKDMNWGSVILSGGRGSRMGYTDKSSLTCGGRTFLDIIGKELHSLEIPCYLSRAAYKGSELVHGFTMIEDMVQGAKGEWIGPMGGIWSCFERTEEQCLFFVSCDMPLFRARIAERLLEYWKPGTDAVLWRTRDGRLQPMCALYSRSCMKELKKCIDKQNYRMMDFLGHLNCVVVETAREHIPDRWFLNVNTPEIHAELKKTEFNETDSKEIGLKKMHPPVLAVSGRKNTGKTWLLERLVEVCKRAGIRTAVIKHDGHEFEADVPGTDSYRIKKAGAYGTVVYSGSQFSLVKEQIGLEAADFFGFFPEADIIFLEGQKHSAYPKVEVLRKAISTEPVCSPETVLAYVSDGIVDQGMGGVRPVLSFQSIDEIAEVVIGFLDGAHQEP